jgi:hypothetical protein
VSSRYHNHVAEDALLGATRALLKFCRDHQYPEGGLKDLLECQTALEGEDFGLALFHFKRMSFGGMGRFDDWWPPVVSEQEDEAYVATVFEALVERFCRLFRAAGRLS